MAPLGSAEGSAVVDLIRDALANLETTIAEDRKERNGQCGEHLRRTARVERWQNRISGGLIALQVELGLIIAVIGFAFARYK